MNIVLFEAHEMTTPLAPEDPRSRHLSRVLRLKVGDQFRSGIVNGFLGHSIITAIHDGCFHLCHHHDTLPPPQVPLHLVIGTPRPNSVKRILRESASLGVQKIIFVATELGEKSYRDSHVLRPETIRSLLKEGACQAYSSCLPDVSYSSLKLVLEQKQDAIAIAFDTHPSATPVSQLRWPKPQQGLYLLIGSERGWSHRERQLMTDYDLSFSLLGSRVLRSETACIAAITLAQHHLGYI